MTSASQALPSQKKSYTPQEAAALGLGWVDTNHAAYGKPGYVGSEQPQAPAGGGGTQGPSGPAPIQSGTQALQGSATVGNQIQQGAPTTIGGAFQQALINKLAPQTVSADSPHLKPAIDAYRLAQQRAAERQRAALAERAHAGGYDGSGAFDSLILGIEADRAMREGAFEGDLLHDAQTKQDQMLMAALGLGGNMLSQQDQLAQQKYGMDLDAQLRREGLGVQSDLGNKDISLRGELGKGQLNLGLLSALLQNQQFGQNLGAQLGMFGAGLNQNALLNLLR